MSAKSAPSPPFTLKASAKAPGHRRHTFQISGDLKLKYSFPVLVIIFTLRNIIIVYLINPSCSPEIKLNNPNPPLNEED